MTDNSGRTETVYAGDGMHDPYEDSYFYGSRPMSLNGSRPGSPDSAATENAYRYVPPHKRRVNLDMGDEVVVESRDKEKTDLPGSANKRYARLLHRSNFVLEIGTTKYITRQFPGIFPVSSGHENHPHGRAHTISSIVFRFATRRLPRGTNILVIGGIPKECALFNKSQAASKQPKTMTALVDLFHHNDFLRCLNKWGPRYTIDEDTGDVKENYLKGRVTDFGPDVLGKFDAFIFHHTGYYHTMQDYLHIVRCNEQARIIITTLRHDKSAGELFEGEMSYQSVFSRKHGFEIVKQKNRNDNGVYCHPNIFKQFWKPSSRERSWRPEGEDLGLTWEMSADCDDSYTIQMNSYRESLISKNANLDWANEFELAQFEGDGNAGRWVEPKLSDPIEYVDGGDGKFIKLDITNKELVNKLRVQVSGESRVGRDGQELLKRMFQTARTLVNPGGLFPGQEPMVCAPNAIADHVVSAWVSDMGRETDVLSAIAAQNKYAKRHLASSTVPVPRLGPKASLSENLEALRVNAKSFVLFAMDVRKSNTTVTDAALSSLNRVL